MLTQEKRNQIFFQISMGIGESLDLTKMLSVSLSRYLKELGCTMGAVLLTERDFSHRISFSVAYSIPRRFERSEGFKSLIEEVSKSKNIEADIISGRIKEGFYYIMGLGDIGLLVLLKRDGELSKGLLDSLEPLNKKLGAACRACLQNDKFQRSSSRFMEMANMLPAIIIELDTEYRLSYINKSTYEIFKQIDSEYFKPTSVFDFFPEEERTKVEMLLEQADTSGRMNSMDLWMKNSRNETFPVQVLFSPIVHDNALVGYRGIGIDISEKYEHQRQQQRLMDALSERVRELDCLYGITRVLSEEENTLENIFIKAVEIIPPSFDTPEQTSARIEFEGREYTSRNFRSIEPLQSRSAKILVNGKALGSIVVRKESKETFDAEERNLIDALGTQFGNIASTKLAEEERNRLYQDLMDDMDIAQSVQSYLLPQWSSLYDDMLMSSIYTPSTKVGGDLFDVLQITETVFVFYVGDISGHGVQAALTMTAVKSIVNMIISQHEDIPSPSVILTQLNEILSKRLFNDNYMTMMLCIVDTAQQRITSISAGHPQGLIIDAKTGELRQFDDLGGIPLGWMNDYEYTTDDEFSSEFSRDDVICLFTDGLFDASKDDGSRIEDTGVIDILTHESDLSNVSMLPYELKKAILSRGFDTSVDDFTFLAFTKLKEDTGKRLFQIQPLFSQTLEVSAICEEYIAESTGDATKALFVKLIINEFVNNVIEHGLAGKTDTVIQIELDIADGTILTFRDKGKQWELPAREDSFVDFFEEMNNDNATRGRGLQMIYSVTSSHTRRRVFDLNETTFILA